MSVLQLVLHGSAAQRPSEGEGWATIIGSAALVGDMTSFLVDAQPASVPAPLHRNPPGSSTKDGSNHYA